VTEREISFESCSLRLAGSLLLPDTDEQVPGVLLIPGSGRLDRDENAKRLRINILREIAVYLAEHGIATLRYDKRGVGASAGNFWETGFHDNVADAEAALHYLEAQDRVRSDKVFLLGHSEGALIATRLAGAGKQVAGLILLAGAASSGEEILRWQAEQIHKGIRGFKRWLLKLLHLDNEKLQRRQLEKVRRSQRDWYRMLLIIKLNAKWLREFLAYHPAADLANIHAPSLAITGSKDIQVNPADLTRMSELTKGECECHALPNITHLLRAEPGEPTLSTYQRQVTHPMDRQVLHIILKWLQSKAFAQTPK
jgi:uncharacterized protein